VERNKVFGKIILNRSRLSGLGKMDVSNVRITATDSQGRSYSTLTDKDGSFVLYAPITDEYTLSINNIFYENFDLRQNNFRVQFNGYKQFEVNYVFDEKIRRINFASTPGGEVQQGVMQVRRTTLSGTVKDANTQNPIRARVNLVNTKNNVVAVSTFSSATSGEYTLSFIAGDNFLIEVLADDYWYLSENLTLNQITTFMNITREVLLKPISVGSKVELNIKFDVNSSFLAPESVAELNRLVRLLRNNPSVKLQVQGHCDDLEGLQKPAIALERANAVIKYLVENGYSNVEAKSLGNTVPLMTNDTEEGRSRNRRVEVEVISK
jgi:outer membrane protein OmpA-like peptidoglycan-associated protein